MKFLEDMIPKEPLAYRHSTTGVLSKIKTTSDSLDTNLHNIAKTRGLTIPKDFVKPIGKTVNPLEQGNVAPPSTGAPINIDMNAVDAELKRRGKL
jgi:hypothetical protein